MSIGNSAPAELAVAAQTPTPKPSKPPKRRQIVAKADFTQTPEPR